MLMKVGTQSNCGHPHLPTCQVINMQCDCRIVEISIWCVAFGLVTVLEYRIKVLAKYHALIEPENLDGLC